MSKNKFNDGFFANVCEKKVWERLSSGDSTEFYWSERLIDRYRDKIDWRAISRNRNVLWSALLLERFQGYLYWDEVSSLDCEGLFSVENLKKFSSKWNWRELSSNRFVCWTMEKVEEFKDFIDWDKIINLDYHEGLYTLDFFEKYKEYIPGSFLQDSSLYEEIVNIYMSKQIEEILAQ